MRVSTAAERTQLLKRLAVVVAQPNAPRTRKPPARKPPARKR